MGLCALDGRKLIHRVYNMRFLRAPFFEVPRNIPYTISSVENRVITASYTGPTEWMAVRQLNMYIYLYIWLLPRYATYNCKMKPENRDLHGWQE